MIVVSMGTITLHTGEEINGLAIEATKEELHKMMNLLYHHVSVIPEEGTDHVRTSS